MWNHSYFARRQWISRAPGRAVQPPCDISCVMWGENKIKKDSSFRIFFSSPPPPVCTIFTVTHFGRVIELVVIINTLIFFSFVWKTWRVPQKLRFFTVVFCDWIRFRIISTSLPSTLYPYRSENPGCFASPRARARNPRQKRTVRSRSETGWRGVVIPQAFRCLESCALRIFRVRRGGKTSGKKVQTIQPRWQKTVYNIERTHVRRTSWQSSLYYTGGAWWYTDTT